MSFDVERIYGLLPAVYRLRDAEQGGELKALLSVIAEQAAVLEEDLAQLYDDQFVETCADWVVPYIGDLIGYRALYGIPPRVNNPRAEVANTIAYRRRKGTASVLEQLARDVTGWEARVVEFFQRLATTQYMNHLRPENFYAPDLRRVADLEYLGTPFDPVPRTADVRRIASGRGLYNIPNVGIFIWRLRAYSVTKGTAGFVQEGCYTFHPFGFDAPLFNPVRTQDQITHLAQPFNVPAPLRRRPLYAELEALRQALAEDKVEADLLKCGVYFGLAPVVRVYLETPAVIEGQPGLQLTEIPAREILLCDLSDWRRPPAEKTYTPRRKPGDAAEPPPEKLPIQVSVDPVLGRLAFPAGTDLTGVTVKVSYSYGFSADMGGGQYSRPGRPLPTATVALTGPGLSDTLNDTAAETERVVEINHSATIAGDIEVTLADGQRLTVQAKDETRPVIGGDITIDVGSGAYDAGVEVTLDGLLVGGSVRVNGNTPLKLTLRDCTVRPWRALDGGAPEPPDTPSVNWPDAAASGRLVVERSITGRLVVPPAVQVSISDSIVDALGDEGLALAASEGGDAAGAVEIARTTVFGRLLVREIVLAENSIFTGDVTSELKQHGCVRFCYLTQASRVPSRYHCQPDLAIQRAVEEARRHQPGLDAAAQEALASDIRSWLKPDFTDQHWSQPGYAQLHGSSPLEIRSGSDDGAEMGAFHDLYQIRRDINLRARLDEYLRFGLEAGVFYAT